MALKMPMLGSRPPVGWKRILYRTFAGPFSPPVIIRLVVVAEAVAFWVGQVMTSARLDFFSCCSTPSSLELPSEQARSRRLLLLSALLVERFWRP